MERVIVLGFGYPVFKAVRLIRELKPGADLLWLTEYSELKYPSGLVDLLLSLGLSPKSWPRARAKIKVDFEKRMAEVGTAPVRARKILLDPGAGEVSFLSNTGNMTYFFDQAFIFPEPVFKSAHQGFENAMIWPESSCVENLVQNWDDLHSPVVAGNDLSLVQALFCGGMEFTWVRSSSVFADQVQFFLDRYLESHGVSIVQGESLQKPEYEAAIQGRPVLLCSRPVLDQDRLSALGLKGFFDSAGQAPVMVNKNITLVVPFLDQESWSLGSSLDYSRQIAEHAVRRALGGHEGQCPAKKVWSWSMGRTCAGKSGLGVEEARVKGFDPEWVIVTDGEDPWSSEKFVLKVVADKDSRKILGLQAVGRQASSWLDAGGILLSGEAGLEEVLNQDLTAFSFGSHPLKRCASMLMNKLNSNIKGISPEELMESARQGAEFFLLDVRTTEEFNRSRLPGAENIPLPQLKKRVMQIPRFVPLVIYSRCSGRAYHAARLLKSMGAKDLYVLDGGMELWIMDKDREPGEKRPGILPGCPSC